METGACTLGVSDVNTVQEQYVKMDFLFGTGECITLVTRITANNPDTAILVTC